MTRDEMIAEIIMNIDKMTEEEFLSVMAYAATKQIEYNSECHSRSRQERTQEH